MLRLVLPRPKQNFLSCLNLYVFIYLSKQEEEKWLIINTQTRRRKGNVTKNRKQYVNRLSVRNALQLADAGTASSEGKKKVVINLCPAQIPCFYTETYEQNYMRRIWPNL